MPTDAVSLDLPAGARTGAPPGVPPGAPRATVSPGLRFDRTEWSGALGDLGTDLPLLVGMVAAAHLDPARVFGVYGLLQVLTGVVYRMPMPVQPLKAVAAIVIAGGAGAAQLRAGGFAIGAIMLALAALGGLDRLQRWVPPLVVRGIQLGLALQLGRLALTRFIPAEGTGGALVAAVAVALALALRGSTRVPPAFAVVPLGIAWAAWRAGTGAAVAPAAAPVPVGWAAFLDAATLGQGLVLLALPQLALSLGNSVLATHRIARDLFPDRAPSVRRIGLTYAAMNLASPFLGGVPVCHGSGGIAGHHAFGARTGGSVVLYGLGWMAAAAAAALAPDATIALVPAPILGALLAVEALALVRLLGDVPRRAAPLGLVATLAATAAFAPYGYAIALAVGLALAPAIRSLSSDPR